MESLFDFAKDPLQNFQIQFSSAEKSITKDVNAMSLATVGKDGKPSLRTVLFKGLLESGFTFYTNYQSQKAQEILLRSEVSLLFFWKEIDQQIRIEGIVQKLSRETSEKYFSTRPRESQIGAWASAQSTELKSLEDLDRVATEVEAKFRGQEIPCPPHWGGFLVRPTMIEFWFGQKGRLHHRYIFEKKNVNDAHWRKYLKFP